MALHTEMYFANNPTEEDAFVLSVDKSKLSVIVPRFGIEGSVRVSYRLSHSFWPRVSSYSALGCVCNFGV